MKSVLGREGRQECRRVEGGRPNPSGRGRIPLVNWLNLAEISVSQLKIPSPRLPPAPPQTSSATLPSRMDADVRSKHGRRRRPRARPSSPSSSSERRQRLAVHWTFNFRRKLYLITDGGRYGEGEKTYWVSQGGPSNTFLLEPETFHAIHAEKREDSSMLIGRFVRGCLARKLFKRLSLQKVVDDLIFEIEYDRDFQCVLRSCGCRVASCSCVVRGVPFLLSLSLSLSLSVLSSPMSILFLSLTWHTLLYPSRYPTTCNLKRDRRAVRLEEQDRTHHPRSASGCPRREDPENGALHRHPVLRAHRPRKLGAGSETEYQAKGHCDAVLLAQRHGQGSTPGAQVEVHQRDADSRLVETASDNVR